MNTEIATFVGKMQAMINGFIALLPNIILALIVFAIFFFVDRTIQKVVRNLTRDRCQVRNLGMVLVLGQLAQGTTILIGLFIALLIVIPSLKASNLVQLLGISGIVIGFAFRDIFQNFLAGISIPLTEPFQIDDQIVFKEFEGTVENIQTRATTIKTYDGRRVVVPDSELFTNSVTVNTAFESRRLEYEIGMGYGDDIDEARRLILEAVYGIALPFPTQQILFHDQTEETDGDRTHQREGWPARKDKVPQSQSISSSLKQLAEIKAQRNGFEGDSAKHSLEEKRTNEN